MNLVDGVRIRDMYEGARLWRQYEREPNFLANADQRVRDAFDAVARQSVRVVGMRRPGSVSTCRPGRRCISG